MNSTRPLGQLLQSFFVDHLITVKGLRPASVRSYRDTIRQRLQNHPPDNQRFELRSGRRIPTTPRRRPR